MRIKMVNIRWDSQDCCFVLRASVLLQRSRESLFDFFRDTFQLEQHSPVWLNFRILTPESRQKKMLEMFSTASPQTTPEGTTR